MSQPHTKWLNRDLRLELAISIPFLIGLSRPHDPEWSAHVRAYATAYWTITVAFNLVVTALIITRLIMLRQKVEQVMGKVQSVFYTSHCTTFVESGAFFTLWSFCHLILFARNSWIQDVFLFPAMYIAVRSIPSFYLASPPLTLTTGNNKNHDYHPNGSEQRVVERYDHGFRQWNLGLASFVFSEP